MGVPLAKTLVKPLSAALDWLLPPLCPATGQDVDVHGTVAPDYWASLRFIRPPACGRCAIPFPHTIGGTAEGLICAACLEHPPRFNRGRSALVYDDASRSLVLRFKHGDQLQAIRTLVPWLLEAGGDILPAADLLVPVPLHRWRFLKRRYNQSALLAQGLARATGRTCCPDALLRVRATPPQGQRTRREREANVRGAFSVNPGRAGMVAGKNILLIDDVMTTGATLGACAEALMAAGAAGVDVLTVARAVRD